MEFHGIPWKCTSDPLAGNCSLTAPIPPRQVTWNSMEFHGSARQIRWPLRLVFGQFGSRPPQVPRNSMEFHGRSVGRCGLSLAVPIPPSTSSMEAHVTSAGRCGLSLVVPIPPSTSSADFHGIPWKFTSDPLAGSCSLTAPIPPRQVPWNSMEVHVRSIGRCGLSLTAPMPPRQVTWNSMEFHGSSRQMHWPVAAL